MTSAERRQCILQRTCEGCRKGKERVIFSTGAVHSDQSNCTADSPLADEVESWIVEIADSISAPYPKDIFRPLTTQKKNDVHSALFTSRVHHAIDRLHAEWARRIAKSLKERAR